MRSPINEYGELLCHWRYLWSLHHEDVWKTPLWKSANERFEESLLADSDLLQFSNKYFWVYEGKYGVTAWMRYIEAYRKLDPTWYIFVDCIVVDARGESNLLMEAMNDINWWVKIYFYITWFSCIYWISTVSSFVLYFTGPLNMTMSKTVCLPNYNACASLASWNSQLSKISSL